MQLGVHKEQGGAGAGFHFQAFGAEEGGGAAFEFLVQVDQEGVDAAFLAAGPGVVTVQVGRETSHDATGPR